MKIILRFFLLLFALLLGGIALLSVRLDLFPSLAPYLLQEPFAQIIALRGVLAVGIFGCGLLCAIFSLIRRRRKGRGKIAACLALLLLLAALGHGATIFQRGVHNLDKLPQGVPGSINVLTYNTQGGATDMADIAEIVKAEQVDIVVLPETSAPRGKKLVEMLDRAGYTYQYFDTHTSRFQPEFSSTILLISDRLGEYELDTSSSYVDGEISFIKTRPVLDPVASTAWERARPNIIATHPIAPMPERQGRWKKEITTVYENCRENTNFIMAGDFNSTFDHQAALGAKCKDAAKEAGSGALGTWPSDIYPLFASPIDRIVHGGKYYRGKSARLVQVGGSDHRGLLVQLRWKDSEK